MYDKDWFIGVAQDVYFDLCTKNLNKQYFWPARKDNCWIPVANIMKKFHHQSDLQLDEVIHSKAWNWKILASFKVSRALVIPSQGYLSEH